MILVLKIQIMAFSSKLKTQLYSLNTIFLILRYSINKETCDNVHYLSKRTYCENRGLTWIPTNKRPHKLKDKIKEFEVLN